MYRKNFITGSLKTRSSETLRLGIMSIDNKVHAERYLSKDIIYPALIHPYEEYRFITDMVVPNIMPERYMISNFGNTWDRALGKPIPTKLNKNQRGYLTFKVAYYKEWNLLANKDVYVHRAVIITFGPVDNYQDLQVNHINGNKLDNRFPANLEWVSARENNLHAIETGLRRCKIRDKLSQLSDFQVHEICRRIETGENRKDIAKSMRIPEIVVDRIYKREAYVNISRQYNMPALKTPSKALPDEIVHSICTDIASGMKEIEVARKYGLGRHIISDIRHRRNYTHISSNYVFPEIRKQLKFTDEDYHKVCQMLQDGYDKSHISIVVGMSTHMISNVQDGILREDISNQYTLPKKKQYNYLNEMEIKKIKELIITHPDLNNFQIAEMIGCQHYQVRDIRSGKYFK